MYFHEGICENHLGVKALAFRVLRQAYYKLTVHRDAEHVGRMCHNYQIHVDVP